MEHFLEAKQDAGKHFYLNYREKGKIVMLNLLRFCEIANLDELKSMEEDQPISGAKAYNVYMEKALPIIQKAGSKILFYGECGSFLIGPSEEKWDAMLIVEHESAQKFIEFAQNEDYLKILKYRTAALLDSRLMPIKSINTSHFQQS